MFLICWPRALQRPTARDLFLPSSRRWPFRWRRPVPIRYSTGRRKSAPGTRTRRVRKTRARATAAGRSCRGTRSLANGTSRALSASGICAGAAGSTRGSPLSSSGLRTPCGPISPRDLLLSIWIKCLETPRFVGAFNCWDVMGFLISINQIDLCHTSNISIKGWFIHLFEKYKVKI